MSEVATEETPTVLIVDDEPDLAEMYAEFLAEVADVDVASNGEAALEKVDDGVDVVFLDREMPGMTGDEVLSVIREEGHDCYVAMLTAVEPELDVFDMPFDEYVVKPVSKGDLRTKLDQLLQRSEFGEDMRELFAKTSKRHVLKGEDAGDAWSKKEISTIVDQAEVAPAPGIFGGWKSGYMAMREEREREFAAAIERLSLPVLLERVAGENESATATAFRLDAHPRSMGDVIGDVDDDLVALSYGQVRSIVRTLTLGFDGLGVSSDAPVLLASGPRPEAAWCDFAVLAAGGVVVGTDHTASAETFAERVDATDPLGAVVENVEILRKWDDVLAESPFEFVVVLDELDDEGQYRSPVASLGTLYREADRGTEERRYADLLERTSPDSPAGLVLADGISPLILSHRNLVENAAQVFARLTADEDGPVDLSHGDRILTGMPPREPHGRILNHYVRLLFGGTTVYAETVDTFRADARRVGATLVAAPTGVAESVTDDVVETVVDDATFGSQGLLDWATSKGVAHRHVEEPGAADRAMEWAADRVGLSRFRALLGDPDAILVGPDPLDEDAHRQYYGAGIVPVCLFAAERTGVVLAASPPEDPRTGRLGVPLYDEEVEVKWTPSTPPSDDGSEVGELAVAGPNVPRATWGDSTAANPFAEDGLLKTGEMIEWDADDFLVRRS